MHRLLLWTTAVLTFTTGLLSFTPPARAGSGAAPDAEQIDYVLGVWNRVEIQRAELTARLEDLHAAMTVVAAHDLRGLLTFADPQPSPADPAIAVQRSAAFSALSVANASASAAATSTERAEAELRTYTSMIGVQGEVPPSKCPAVDTALLRDGAPADICRRSVAAAPSPLGARAIIEVFSMLGAPYACQSIGRLGPVRYDCSSLVTIAYTRAGAPITTDDWAPTTRDMFPWDGHRRAAWATVLVPGEVRSGDLALYEGGTHHVVMVLTDGFMAHTASCGDVAHVTRLRPFTRPRGFAGVRRVVP